MKKKVNNVAVTNNEKSQQRDIIKKTLEKSASYYFINSSNISYKCPPQIDDKDIVLFRIEEVTYDDNAPRKEALENVISSLQLDGIIFLYLIRGTSAGVEFYYGVAKEGGCQSIDDDWASIYDIGKYVLRPTLQGNFRGSKISIVKPQQKLQLMNELKKFKNVSMLEGVPGIVEDNEKFQSVDRLVNTMLGDSFVVLVQAKALTRVEIEDIEQDIFKFYENLVPAMKMGVQMNEGTTTVESKSTTISESSNSSTQTASSESHNTNSSFSEAKSNGSQETTGTNRSTSTSKNVNSGSTSKSESGTEGSSTAKTSTESTQSTKGSGESKTTGESTSKSKGVVQSRNESQTTTTNYNLGNSSSVEEVNRMIQSWIQYMDDVLLKRIDYGKGKGLFVTSIALFAENNSVLHKLENTMRSIYSGETGNKVPMQPVRIHKLTSPWQAYTNLQMPIVTLYNLSKPEEYARSCFSQYFLNNEATLGNWISTNELSLITGLPRKEVVGIGLREEVEFGLNFQYKGKEDDKLILGNLVQSGEVIKSVPVSLDKSNLNKHTFITGVTGSGKTTTCQKILYESGVPFLVIEPAKTEYRSMISQYSDLLVFTPGRDDLCPFRLNPFEFFPHESITSRVDMIKASIEASFDMEAAIPQIIEASIYRCYKKCGWDIESNTNFLYEDPFADGVYAFPTLSDLIEETKKEVEEQGFDDRLKNDYIGSIRARLQGLIVGAKGQMLNAPRSIDFKDLLDRRVVIELEEIRDGSHKSLLMGFILMNLVEALKAKYVENGEFQHILLVEEAHRLLSRYMPGDSLTKKQSVEAFSDLLAEVRKYGESLVIVDQIPGKLTPEVLKNTNTKIVHKIFAQDDKEAIGNTMVLKAEQKEFLSNLNTGRAVVFTQGWTKALQVQVTPLNLLSNDYEINQEKLRDSVLAYYLENYKKGIFPEIGCAKNKPTLAYFKTGIQQRLYSAYLNLYQGEINIDDITIAKFLKAIKELHDTDLILWDDAIDMLFSSVYRKETKYATPQKLRVLFKKLLAIDIYDSNRIKECIENAYDELSF